MKKSADDARWFIWTIVFLVVAGVSLVTYIWYSSETASENGPASFLVHHPKKLPMEQTTFGTRK